MFEVLCNSRENEEAWLKLRQLGVSSSDAAVLVMGRCFGRTPLDLFMEKVGTKERPPLDTEGMRWGNAIEPTLIQRWKEAHPEYNAEPWGELLRSKEWPFMLCTPDANFWLANHALAVRAYGVLEIKTSGRGWDEGIPKHVWVQVQHQLAVTGFQFGGVAVLAGSFGGLQFFEALVERDEDFIQQELMPLCQRFWRQVEEREPPPVRAREKSDEYVQPENVQRAGRVPFHLAGPRRRTCVPRSRPTTGGAGDVDGIHAGDDPALRGHRAAG